MDNEELNVSVIADALRAEGVPAQFDWLGGGAWMLYIGAAGTDMRGYGSWPLTLGPCRPIGPDGPFLASGDDIAVRHHTDDGIEWLVPQQPWATPATITRKILTMMESAPPAGFDRDRLRAWMTGTQAAGTTQTLANLAMFPDRWDLWVNDADGYLHDVCDLVHAAVRDQAVTLPGGVSDLRAWHVHDSTESWPWESGASTSRGGTIAFVVTLSGGGITLVTSRCHRGTFQSPDEGLDGALHALEIALRQISTVLGRHQTRHAPHATAGRSAQGPAAPASRHES
ncbi:hypothetical protein AB0B66_10555 [Catellatospora sp. NPDC049111]|uniref:hypothetical protein n=1 Tax=Catellatospora sp. NPDC049111 TaxID=3155271 RepID=UPI0033F72C13